MQLGRQFGAKIQTVVSLYMTPKDLRQIADDMEKKWGVIATADNVFVKQWDGDHVDVLFKIDRVAMERDFGSCGKQIPAGSKGPNLIDLASKHDKPDEDDGPLGGIEKPVDPKAKTKAGKVAPGVKGPVLT